MFIIDIKCKHCRCIQISEKEQVNGQCEMIEKHNKASLYRKENQTKRNDNRKKIENIHSFT